MKFSIAAVAAFVSAVVAADLPAAFTLVADGGRTVLTDGQYLYAGGNTSDTREILILHSAANGAVTFTSTSETPTGWQNLYVVSADTSAVGLTRPHSAAIPDGATINGFGVNDQGLFTNGGNAYFAIDGYGESDTGATIYWYGRHSSEYKAENLYVKEFN